jgi:hypothetical protein
VTKADNELAELYREKEARMKGPPPDLNDPAVMTHMHTMQERRLDKMAEVAAERGIGRDKKPRADELSPHSPAQVIITSLRKAWLLKTCNLYGDAGPALVKKLSLYIRDCPLTEALAEAHVYDLGFMMDSGHATSLTTAAQKQLFQESRDLYAGSGLFLPFATTLFIQRSRDGRVTDAQGGFRSITLTTSIAI